MTTLTDLLSGIVPDAVIQGDDLGGTFDIVHPVAPYSLFDYQIETLEHIFRSPQQRYAYAGLDMGLGKSLVAWSLIASVRNPANPDAYKRPVLFVVPPSLRQNIIREAAKFYPDLKVHLIQTTKPAEGETIPTDVDAIVIGDMSFKGSMQEVTRGQRKQYVPAGWTEVLAGKVDGIVVDEAHRLKNRTSNRSKALAYLGERCTGYKVLMSGTPFPNGRNIEIATQTDVLGPGAWADIGGRGRFYTYFAPMDTLPNGQAVGRRNLHGAELNALMESTWFFRRKRDEVIDLPAKGRSFVGIEGSGKGARDYLKAEKDLISYLRDEEKNTDIHPRAAALVRMNNLRRLAGVARAANVAQHVKEILEEQDEGGVFLVAEHSEVIDTLMVKLLKYNPVTVRGGMSGDERMEAIDAFTSGESRVLVGQITAAGTGFTLHGDGRNHRVVFAQIPWTPAEVRQAEDRLHRIGQTKDVHVELTGCLIPEADQGTTIDERLWATLEQKAFNMSEVTDGEGEFLLEAVQDALLDSYR